MIERIEVSSPPGASSGNATPHPAFGKEGPHSAIMTGYRAAGRASPIQRSLCRRATSLSDPRTPYPATRGLRGIRCGSVCVAGGLRLAPGERVQYELLNPVLAGALDPEHEPVCLIDEPVCRLGHGTRHHHGEQQCRQCESVPCAEPPRNSDAPVIRPV